MDVPLGSSGLPALARLRAFVFHGPASALLAFKPASEGPGSRCQGPGASSPGQRQRHHDGGDPGAAALASGRWHWQAPRRPPRRPGPGFAFSRTSAHRARVAQSAEPRGMC
jgi:hypothetical protein